MNERLNYLDTLKGIAILCIVLLHFEDGVFPKYINTIIGFFMITAFYVSTGIIYAVKSESPDIRSLVVKRFNQLIKPYIWFSILILLFDLILWLFREQSTTFILKEFFYTITLRGIGTLWFLPVLYIAELIFVRSLSHKCWIIIVSSIGFLLLYGWITQNNILMKFSDIQSAMLSSILLTIYRIIVAVGTIGGSYIIEKCYGKFLHSSAKRSLLWGVLFVMIGIAVIYISNFQIIYLVDWVRKMIAFVMLPYGLSLILYSIKQSCITQALSFWGRNSLIVMATHYSFLLTICTLFNKYCGTGGDLTGKVSLIYFVIAVIVEVPIIYFVNKYLKFLIGK